MPPLLAPSSILSRVVAQDACLASLTSVRPYLANKPFSLAMISGDASVRAMKPKVTVLVSTPAPCDQAPPGKVLSIAANKEAAPAPFKSLRRVVLLDIEKPF